jgi:hypothetical protein
MATTQVNSNDKDLTVRSIHVLKGSTSSSNDRLVTRISQARSEAIRIEAKINVSVTKEIEDLGAILNHTPIDKKADLAAWLTVYDDADGPISLEVV